MSNEELYAVALPNGGTFRCVKSQLLKNKGKCPVTGKQVLNTTTGQFDYTEVFK